MHPAPSVLGRKTHLKSGGFAPFLKRGCVVDNQGATTFVGRDAALFPEDDVAFEDDFCKDFRCVGLAVVVVDIYGDVRLRAAVRLCQVHGGDMRSRR